MDREEYLVVFALTIFLCLLGVAYAWGNKARCTQTWSESGMPVKWGLMSGCRVQQKDGTWIPAESYRVVGEGQ